MLIRQMALTGLTEGYGQISARQANVYKEKLQNSVKCINLLLGSWSGEWFPCFDLRRDQFESERPRSNTRSTRRTKMVLILGAQVGRGTVLGPGPYSIDFPSAKVM